jgi:F-type H+-transporting ATPase subunit b
MTTGFIRAAGVLAAVLLLPAAALADAGAGAGAGQPNVLKPDLVNSIVTLVVFGVLLALLYAFAWGPIVKGLQIREEAQFEALAEAKKAKEEAAALRTHLQAELAAAAEKVRGILDEARKDAERLKADEVEKGVKEAQAEVARARRDAEADRAAMTKAVQAKAVELAVLIATKALRQQVTIEDQHRLLDESIAQLAAGPGNA